MAYQENSDFSIALKEKAAVYSWTAMQVKDKGYYVFHDVYGYFEQEFELNNLGQLLRAPT